MTDYDTLLYNQDTTQKTIKDYSAFVKAVDRSMTLQNRKDKKNDNSRRTDISTEIEI